MEHYKQHYYSGNYYQRYYMSGFTLNPYDKCEANKNGKQCTSIWHVDILKISHVSKDVVENILKKLNDKFRKESSFTACRGKVLEC